VKSRLLEAQLDKMFNPAILTEVFKNVD